jgi:hypothetical protein
LVVETVECHELIPVLLAPYQAAFERITRENAFGSFSAPKFAARHRTGLCAYMQSERWDRSAPAMMVSARSGRFVQSSKAQIAPGQRDFNLA